jgi:4-amino-4-deoxy-L-arabinose transferase-like glycosyltransferase
MLFLLLNFLIPQIYQINPAGYFSTHTFNSADLDALQMLFIVLAFFLIFYNFKNKALSFLLSYFFLGLGYLTKGPLVFLPLVMNSIYIFKHGVKLKSLALGITVFLMPILIWYGFMIVNFGSSFLNEQLNYHVYQRAFSTLEGHSEPIYFYIQLFIDPRVNLLGIPFILVFLNKLKIRDRQRKIRLYSFLFIVITLLIITIANTRLAWYIIPIYPFLALFLSI